MGNRGNFCSKMQFSLGPHQEQNKIWKPLIFLVYHRHRDRKGFITNCCAAIVYMYYMYSQWQFLSMFWFNFSLPTDYPHHDLHCTPDSFQPQKYDKMVSIINRLAKITTKSRQTIPFSNRILKKKKHFLTFDFMRCVHKSFEMIKTHYNYNNYFNNGYKWLKRRGNIASCCCRPIGLLFRPIIHYLCFPEHYLKTTMIS